MSRRRSDLIAIVEAAYRLDGDDETWIERIAHAASPLLDAGQGVAGYLLDTNAAKPTYAPVLVGRDPWGGGWREAWWDTRVARMPARLVAELAGFGSPTYASQSCGAVVRGGVVARISTRLAPLALPAGVNEALVICGYDAGGHGAVLFAFRPGQISVRPAGKDALAWERISGHLTAASRLRARRRSRAVEPSEVPRSLARGLDAVRGRRRADPDALAHWPALHAGGMTVTPSGNGYQAFANVPTGPAFGALTPRERATVALLDLGRSNKAIAYELGIAASTVSTLLSRAARKLGVADTRALIARTRGVVHTRPTSDLTEGEAVIMALLAAGLSDREIAAARSTSRGTITKQVDAVFRKLGVSSRRELSARMSSFAPWTGGA